MKNTRIYIDVDGTLLDHSHDLAFISSGYDVNWYESQYVADLPINIGLVGQLIELKKHNTLVLWTNRGEGQREMTRENLGNIWNLFDEHQFHTSKKLGTNVDGYTFDNEAKYINNNGTLVPNYKGDNTMLVLAIISALRQHIVSSCIAAADGQLFPCTKQSVYAVVITADGHMYYGANWMTASDVTICPRILANTTSYELCATICGQGTEFHAERQAMWSALYDGADLTGAEMFITGHTYCCDTCSQAMFDEGIVYAGSLDSGRYYERGVDTMKEMLMSSLEEVTVETWICSSCGTVCLCNETKYTEDGEEIDHCLCECCADEQNELCHGNYYPRGSIYINFDDSHASAMTWVAIEHARLVRLYAHGQTMYTDVYHNGAEMYSYTKHQRHTLNIYSEPTFVYDEVKHFEGSVIEWHGTMVGINRGAFTAIELRPYLAPTYEDEPEYNNW